jgi:hypothetical protein
MDFLYLDTDGVVKIVPEALEYPEIKAFKDHDWLSKAIKYVYHTYKFEHPLASYGRADRSLKVCKTYFTEEQPSTFESDKKVVALTKRYTTDAMSSSQRFYQKLQEDMDRLRDHIANIPWWTKEEVETTVQVEFMRDDKAKEVRDITTKVMVNMDNSKAKLDALKRADELIKIEQSMRKSIAQETRELKLEKSSERLFDRR